MLGIYLQSEVVLQAMMDNIGVVVAMVTMVVLAFTIVLIKVGTNAEKEVV